MEESGSDLHHSLITSSSMASQTTLILVSFFLLTALSFSSSSCYAQLSYSDHCASIVPESSPTELFYPYYSPRGVHEGYFRNPNQSSHDFNGFNFEIQTFHKTHVEGLFMVDGNWWGSHNRGYDKGSFGYGRQSDSSAGLILWRNFSSSAGFRLNGFWLKSSGNLCMVGLGSIDSTRGKHLGVNAVLKLNNFKNSTEITSLVSGTLDLLSSENYTLPLLMFPESNYNFTLVQEQIGDEAWNRKDFPQGLPLSSLSLSMRCRFWLRIDSYILKYTSRALSFKNYSLFGDYLEYLPGILSFDRLKCSEDKLRSKFLIVFSNSTREFLYGPFNPNISLIGEALWDEKENRVIIVACRFLGVAGLFDDVRVGDCSIRLSFLYPKTRSIRDTSVVLGKIWSTKGVNESGYFDTIMFQRSGVGREASVEVKHEYTEIENSKRFCPTKKPVENGLKGFENAYGLSFYVFVRSSRGIFSGYFHPRYVGDHYFDRYSISLQDILKASFEESGKTNISYTINIGPDDENPIDEIPMPRVNILAEGVYDIETGSMCMIGCRDVGPINQILENSSFECEILVTIDFLPSKTNQKYVNGSIKSLRKKYDPLYFEPWELISPAIGWAAPEEFIWRLDMEVVMVLISTTFSCIFLVLQLFHVKKHPQLLPFISISMLLLLTLDYMVPLVLTFRVLFGRETDKKFLSESDGWLDEMAVRAIKMVAFLLQFYLLRLAWFARRTEKNRNKMWAAEKKAIAGTLLFYAVVGSVVALFNTSPENYHRLWRNLLSFCGLVVASFLLPQILINLFGNFEGKLLSSSFYAGNTVVRLTHYAYNANGLESGQVFVSSFPYVNTDLFYSTAWDVTIFLAGLVLVITIYLQQKLGGRIFLVGKFRKLKMKHNLNKD